MAGEGGLVAKLTRDSKVVTEVLGEKVKEDPGGGSGLASRHVRLLYFFSLLSLGAFLIQTNSLIQTNTFSTSRRDVCLSVHESSL